MIVSTVLVVVVVVGGWLRIGGIDQVGIRFEDEAGYYADARLWHRCAKLAVDPVALVAVAMGEKAIVRGRLEQIGVRFQDRYNKPSQGYTFLGSAMMFVVGEGPVALALVNALAGTASILLVYFIGASLSGRAVGLIAAIVLALSPYHLLYSRSVFSDSTVIFFCLLGVYFWIRGVAGDREVRWALILSALSFGYALTCHYRSGYVLGLVALAEVVRVVLKRGRVTQLPFRSVIWRWFGLCLLFFVPAMAIESGFRLGQLAAWSVGGDFPLITYFESAYHYAILEQVVGASRGGGSFWGVNPEAVRAFAAYLTRLQGIPACALGLVGMLVLLRRRGLGLLPVVIVVVTIALLSCQPYVVARGFSFAVPFLAICTAVGIAWVSAWMARRRVAAISVVLLALAVVPVLGSTATIYRRASGLGGACAFLSSAGAGRAIVAEDPLKYEVLSQGEVELVCGRGYRASGTPCEMLEKMRADGIRWVIADPQRWHYRDAEFAARDGVFVWWEAFEELLHDRAKLVFEAQHVAGDPWEFLAEGPGLIYLEEMSRRGDGAIRIYELSPIAG